MVVVAGLLDDEYKDDKAWRLVVVVVVDDKRWQDNDLACEKEDKNLGMLFMTLPDLAKKGGHLVVMAQQ